MKPLIPKSFKGMKANEALLKNMLIDIEHISEELLTGHRMELTVLGILSLREVNSIAHIVNK